MIEGFLDRIGGLFDKGLLLAAVFPLLIVGGLVVAGAAAMLGVETSLHWLDELSVSDKAALAAFTTGALCLGAVVLRSSRALLLRIWSGDGAPRRLVARAAAQRKAMEAEMGRASAWAGTSDDFSRRMIYARHPVGIPASERDKLLVDVAKLEGRARLIDASAARATYDQIAAELEDAYRSYDGDSLIQIRMRLQAFVETREKADELHRYTQRVRLGLEFGKPGTERATRLGNILEALDNYPYSRYRIEAGAFWPHLEQMMKGDLLDDIRERRLLIDFALALASLLMLTATLALILGPLIWFSIAWPMAAAISVLLAYCAYLISIPAAVALSSALRAGCDLYRRDLLVALGVDLPETIGEERNIWSRLSQLVAYGDTKYLTFRVPTAANTAGPT
jgi:hypothetical protein